MALTGEQILISQLKKGDEQAFVALYERYNRLLYSFLLKLGLEQEDIKDLVQQTFSKLWENRANLKEELSLRSYLITIAKNDILNSIKKKILARKHQDSLPGPEERISDLSINETGQILQKILPLLPDKRRDVFALSRIEGYTNEEIAKILNITKSTVENHINQANKQVKDILRRFGLP